MEVLSHRDVGLDLASMQPGGRVMIRTDWYEGGVHGNLAGQCLLTEK